MPNKPHPQPHAVAPRDLEVEALIQSLTGSGDLYSVRDHLPPHAAEAPSATEVAHVPESAFVRHLRTPTALFAILDRSAISPNGRR